MYGILIGTIGPGGSGIMRVHEYDAAMTNAIDTGQLAVVVMPDAVDETISAGTKIMTKQVGDCNEISGWATA